MSGTAPFLPQETPEENKEIHKTVVTTVFLWSTLVSMRKFVCTLTILLCTLSLFAMTGKISSSYPNQFSLSWKPVSGAYFYEILINGKAYAHYDSSVLSCHVGSDDAPLKAEEEYAILVTAKNKQNEKLDVLNMQGKTTSWDGLYSWKNSTKKDNKDRCKEISLRIDTDAEGRTITLLKSDGTFVISPIPLSDEMVPVDEANPTSQALEAMVGIFNATDYDIEEYRIIKDDSDDSGLSIDLETLCKGFTLPITLRLAFSSDGGSPVIDLSCNAKGIYDMMIFKNPEKNSKGVFTLQKL